MTLDFIENPRQKYFCSTAHYSLKMLKINLC